MSIDLIYMQPEALVITRDGRLFEAWNFKESRSHPGCVYLNLTPISEVFSRVKHKPSPRKLYNRKNGKLHSSGSMERDSDIIAFQNRGVVCDNFQNKLKSFGIVPKPKVSYETTNSGKELVLQNVKVGDYVKLGNNYYYLVTVATRCYSDYDDDYWILSLQGKDSVDPFNSAYYENGGCQGKYGVHYNVVSKIDQSNLQHTEFTKDALGFIIDIKPKTTSGFKTTTTSHRAMFVDVKINAGGVFEELDHDPPSLEEFLRLPEVPKPLTDLIEETKMTDQKPKTGKEILEEGIASVDISAGNQLRTMIVQTTNEIRSREMWIANRTKQIAALKDLQKDAVKAYDEGTFVHNSKSFNERLNVIQNERVS